MCGMYSREALLDMHERGHRSLAKVLGHCAQFSADEIDRVLPCFDQYTMRLRLHHIIGAEQYWIGVLNGILQDESADDYSSIAALQEYRYRIAGITDEYLRSVSPEELNTRRTMIVWGGAQHELMPALIVVRTVTHIYHHLGQVLVMCRMLGRPAEGMDFPLL
jgi:uncharacterized damage-inducible protein DinB